MTEARVGLLYNIASCFQEPENNESMKLLRSYYLIRCKEITKGFGLPDKHFSTKTRCPRCCLQWNKDTKVNIKPLKLSTRQKQKIRSMKITNKNQSYATTRKALLQSNEMDQICSFCKHITVTTLLKPEREYNKKGQTHCLISKTAATSEKNANNNKETVIRNKTGLKKVETTKKNIVASVYSNAFDVFSLKNEQNTLASTVKEPPKVIKNSKKKKDKFAGLCQKAVLASAKIKQAKGSTEKLGNMDKLSLFLKPSSG